MTTTIKFRATPRERREYIRLAKIGRVSLSTWIRLATTRQALIEAAAFKDENPKVKT